jgi:hypothetical protein
VQNINSTDSLPEANILQCSSPHLCS